MLSSKIHYNSVNVCNVRSLFLLLDLALFSRISRLGRQVFCWSERWRYSVDVWECCGIKSDTIRDIHHSGGFGKESACGQDHLLLHAASFLFYRDPVILLLSIAPVLFLLIISFIAVVHSFKIKIH